MIFKKKNRAMTILEYTMIVSLVVVVCIVGFRSIGSGYSKIYSNISDAVPGNLPEG
jgi:Flp pilus assembly pilin Flp